MSHTGTSTIPAPLLAGQTPSISTPSRLPIPIPTTRWCCSIFSPPASWLATYRLIGVSVQSGWMVPDERLSGLRHDEEKHHAPSVTTRGLLCGRALGRRHDQFPDSTALARQSRAGDVGAPAWKGIAPGAPRHRDSARRQYARV